MTNYVNFDTPSEKGMIANVFYSNGYGASIERNDQPDLEDLTKKYSLGFLKQQDYHTWGCIVDEKIETISLESNLYNLTEEQLDNYLTQIQAL
jgi:hypothetical protein